MSNQQQNDKIVYNFPEEDEIILKLEDELKWSLFKTSDVQAAYTCGLFFQLVDYDQKKVLKTRSLRKKMRYLFDDLEKTKLAKIIEACCGVQMAVMDKIRGSTLKWPKIRSLVEEKYANAEWLSPSEQLSIGFMAGFDLYMKVFLLKNPKQLADGQNTEEIN